MCALLLQNACAETGELRSGYRVSTGDRSCGGLPAVAIGMQQGLCAGLVLSRESVSVDGEKLRFPRTIVETGVRDTFVVADMGGWEPGRGMVWMIEKVNGEYRFRRLLEGLDMPHGLAIGLHGLVYVGEPGRIFRFDPFATRPEETVETVFSGFPQKHEKYLHPLTHFVFDKNWNLFINIGSAVDQCGPDAMETNSCGDLTGERAQAAIWKLDYKGGGRWSGKPVMYATGLRNSMAMAVHASGSLVQAENSVDYKDPAEPYEEINHIVPGAWYGWPYCDNFHSVSRLWRERKTVSCGADNKTYRPPHALMPPHAAPLGMVYYDRKLLPELQGRLLITWHGYRPTGNRIVSYEVDESGLPLLSAESGLYFQHVQTMPSPERIRFNPAGGLVKQAQHTGVIHDWNSVPGVRPRGSPVGMTVAADGTLWVVEDKNKTVLRITRSDSDVSGHSKDALKDDKVAGNRLPQDFGIGPELMRRFIEVREQVFKPACRQCHAELAETGENHLSDLAYILSQPGWVIPGDPGASVLYQRLIDTNVARRMPLGDTLAKEKIGLVKSFIEDLGRTAD